MVSSVLNGHEPESLHIVPCVDVIGQSPDARLPVPQRPEDSTHRAVDDGLVDQLPTQHRAAVDGGQRLEDAAIAQHDPARAALAQRLGLPPGDVDNPDIAAALGWLAAQRLDKPAVAAEALRASDTARAQLGALQDALSRAARARST